MNEEDKEIEMWASSYGKKNQAERFGYETTHYFTDKEMSDFAIKFRELPAEEKAKLGMLACHALNPRIRNGKAAFYRERARILSHIGIPPDIIEAMKAEFSIQNILNRLGEKREKPEKVLKQALSNLVKHDLPANVIIKSLKELEQALKRRDELNVLFEPSRKDKVVKVLKWFAGAIAGELASRAVEGIVNGIIQLFENK